ncbi:hypothetical protein [Micromonospora sp. WMMD736]|uniref:hypothetical protein n=1 Tax=Micromonospora sp. WMMD736 TaxID=3404112 RepID=UPI003B930998
MNKVRNAAVVGASTAFAYAGAAAATGAAVIGLGIVSLAGPPPAQACIATTNAGGGTFLHGGAVRESCLPNGDKHICEHVRVFGIGGENCWVAPKGHPRNP